MLHGRPRGNPAPVLGVEAQAPTRPAIDGLWHPEVSAVRVKQLVWWPPRKGSGVRSPVLCDGELQIPVSQVLIRFESGPVEPVCMAMQRVWRVRLPADSQAPGDLADVAEWLRHVASTHDTRVQFLSSALRAANSNGRVPSS